VKFRAKVTDLALQYGPQGIIKPCAMANNAETVVTDFFLCVALSRAVAHKA
jgi:hypothetical protein